MSRKIQITAVILLMLIIVISLVVLIEMLMENGEPPKAGDPSATSTMVTSDREDFSKETYLIDITPYRDAIECRDESYLILVNFDHTIGTTVPDNIVYTDVLNEYSFSRYSIEKNTLFALTAMCLEAKANGINGIDLTSAYRSYQKQESLFYTYCERERNKDPSLTQAEAERLVETYSCRPGTSEHQTGLAVDLCVKGDSETLLEESFAETAAGKGLAENCHRFGFVLRFPKDKTDITKIQYEPWHFRFVGYTAASEMKEKGMCLEEYFLYLNRFETESFDKSIENNDFGA